MDNGRKVERALKANLFESSESIEPYHNNSTPMIAVSNAANSLRRQHGSVGNSISWASQHQASTLIGVVTHLLAMYVYLLWLVKIVIDISAQFVVWQCLIARRIRRKEKDEIGKMIYP